MLALADGTIFHGYAIGAAGQVCGEVVFNTAMTGYQEILSDPSYCRQIVTLTYPHIGNVGCNPEDFESRANYAAGLVIRDLPVRAESWRAQQTLSDYLKQHGIVAIAGIDTRQLTRLLSEKGAQSGCISASAEAKAAKPNPEEQAQAIAQALAFPGLAGMDLAKVVSVDTPYVWSGGEWTLQATLQAYRQNAQDSSQHSLEQNTSKAEFHVVAYDFGIKHNILRMLINRGCKVTVVPAQTSAAEVLRYQPDGVFLSNGPGDPEPCTYAIEAIRELLAKAIPLYGICLGHQLLALASGAKTLKMKFGHHGANHPVQDLATKQVLITSQNHGFAVDPNSLPKNLEATHISLFDGSLQGIARTDVPAFSFQGHPEASPGPSDAAYLFDRFITLMRAAKASHA
ncbi:MAG: glutamine-hydrolyzing carbamoyl-phosphate synthase small subunit [Pseudomonadota bacterium]